MLKMRLSQYPDGKIANLCRDLLQIGWSEYLDLIIVLVDG